MSTALATVEPTRSVVPAEWRGKARQFIRRIQQQNDQVTEASRAAFTPLRERVERGHKVPRYTTMIESVRLWQDAMPIGGRLHVECKLERKSLHLIELRLTGCAYSETAWIDDHTDALLLTEFNLVASREQTKTVHVTRRHAVTARGCQVVRTQRGQLGTAVAVRPAESCAVA